MEILGVDIGGSGIKGNLVNSATGELLADRYRIPTPQPSVPDAVADVVAEIAQHFDWTGPIGCTFPAVVRQGVVQTAANVDKSWIGTPAAELFSQRTGCPTTVVNDADAAGIAEINFGAGKEQSGVVLVFTLGTGIGSALFTDGRLVPNTELGHIELRGEDAERYAADSARKREDLSWKKWAGRLNRYFRAIENLFWPDLLIVGGGVSKKHEKFFPYIETRAPLVPAHLFNNAGIVGAAMAAQAQLKLESPSEEVPEPSS
jgi:polyphosphate glucokinase